VGFLTDVLGIYNKRPKGDARIGKIDRSIATSSSSSGGGGVSDAAGGGDPMANYHRGGRVRKTGPARLKKGEVVLTRKQARARKRGKQR
jgi:hypothetical protein